MPFWGRVRIRGCCFHIVLPNITKTSPFFLVLQGDFLLCFTLDFENSIDKLLPIVSGYEVRGCKTCLDMPTFSQNVHLKREKPMVSSMQTHPSTPIGRPSASAWTPFSPPLPRYVLGWAATLWALRKQTSPSPW